MNKLNPIKYIENMISHHPKSISLWITEGIVINGERYIIKEFRLRDGSLYAVIAENKYTPKYFEVKLAPDEETLKDIYQAIKDNKIAIEQEITDRKNEISRVDSAIKANTTKINQEITDRKNEINRVDTKVEANTAKINQEITDRQNDISRVNEAISANTAKINKEITDRQNEISRVDGKIEANTAKINKEITDRQHEISRVDNAIAANTEKINQEIADRTDEINRVNESIESNTAKINQEITDRRNEISRVDNAIKANTAKINQEIADRKSDIGVVNGLISANTSKINKEVTDRQSEISRVENKIAEVQGSIKPIVSGDTGLLTVTNEDSQIKLTSQHDTQKEQVLESRQNTLTITKGRNGTSETTKVDTNPQKVLLHENLATDYGISKNTTGDTTKLGLEYKRVDGGRFDLNNLENGKVRASDFVNAPSTGWLFVSGYSEGNYAIQQAIKLDDPYNTVYVRRKRSGTWDAWREQVGDKSVIDNAIGANTAKINKEITDRQAEISRVNEAISANTAKINKEIQDRQNEISRVDEAINDNTSEILRETNDRINEIARIDGAINKEIQDRKSEITRVEGKIPTNVSTRNLILKSNDFANPHKQNGANTEVTSTNEYFVIKSAGYTANAWGGMSWNMSISEMKAGEEFSILMPVYIDSSVSLDGGVSFIIKNHTLNSSACDYAIPTNKKDQWFNVAITFKAYKDVTFDSYPFYVCIIKNGLVRIKPPMLVRGSLIPLDHQPAPEDVESLIAQKQDKLTAGTGVAIQGNVISATGSSAPQHDTQKEQVLASTRSTITITHGTNGTSETTKVDTNPTKVLEHDNLLTDNGISKTTSGNTTKLGLDYRRVDGARFDLNNLVNGKVRASDFVNAPKANTWYFVSAYTEGSYAIQEAITLVDNKNTTYRRTKQAGTWGSWREQVGDKSVIDATINQLTSRLTALEEKVAELQGKAYKKMNIETNDYTGYYSVYDGKVIKYDVVAKDGKYLDLRNFTFSDGKNPIKGVTFDSNSLSVIYKIYDDQYLHKLVTYDNYAKFSINDQNKIVIDPSSTSQLLRNNLDKVTSFSYVTMNPDYEY